MHRALAPSVLLAGLALPAVAFAGEAGWLPPSDPSAIVGGTQADPCQWPSAVAILEDDETPVMCTGTLINPQVVMTAAHCIIPERPVVAVGFGEHGQVTGVPERTVEVLDCVGNPDYYDSIGADVAYCILAYPVSDVPIVPLLAGCETQALEVGTEVHIVGFGATYGEWDPATRELSTEGVGTKRWTTQMVDGLDEDFEEIYLVGPNGSQSACFGDSGGPGFVRLPDGTWRTFGTGGSLYDPGDLPPPMKEGNICGSGASYGFAPFVIDWLEAETGLDLTPCWDGDLWAPNEQCANFPTTPDIGTGTWPGGCAGGPLGDGAPICEAPTPPPPEPGTTGGADDSGSDDFGDDGPFSTSTIPPIDDTGAPPNPVPPLPGGTAGSDDGASSTGNEPGADNDGFADRGCACRATSGDGNTPLRLLWLALGVVGLRMRRRW